MTSGNKHKQEDAVQRRRLRNIVLGLSLLGLAVLFYTITVLRMGGS